MIKYDSFNNTNKKMDLVPLACEDDVYIQIFKFFRI